MAPQFRNPNVEDVWEDPEYAAKNVLCQVGWDGSLPINLFSICEMYDVEVRFQPEPQMEGLGQTCLTKEGGIYIIINTYRTDCLDGFSNNKSTRLRQRFTLAHELAHCNFKSHVDIALQQNLNDVRNPHAKRYRKIRESQANFFAAFLLIPRSAFDKITRHSDWDNVAEIIELVAEAFDVSLQVAVQQIATLADFPCIAILFKNNGFPLKVPTFSPEFKETNLFFSDKHSVPLYTRAADMLSGKETSSKTKSRYQHASRWFPDAGWRSRQFSIVETSLNLGFHGVATFLKLTEIET